MVAEVAQVTLVAKMYVRIRKRVEQALLRFRDHFKGHKHSRS